MNTKNNNRLWQLMLFILLSITSVKAQKNDDKPQKEDIAVLDFDTRGYNFNQQQAIQFLINELIRIGQYEVMDNYEIEYISKKENITTTGCFSKTCLSEMGVYFKTDKMFTGSLQLLGDRVNVTLRLFDVKTGSFEKTLVKDFLNISGNELMMIKITINEMFNIPNDENTVKKLTMKSEFDNTVNNPYKLILKSDGPRIGLVGFSGVAAEVIQNKPNEGGYGSYPMMFQFGYQFEKQYLNEGNFQALIEFIPTITGLDQGRVIPSISFLNGLRNNVNGWEFAFGPTFNLTKMAKGFYENDANGNEKWYLESDRDLFPNKELSIVSRPDSRGNVYATAGFLFAFGKTFKSGKMNIPLNFFFIPSNNGARFGLSFGWNGKDRYELNE
ncbi:MAG: hypothetical protein Q8K70_07500 [Bacteroidota bacterium]|nr:hypothetical protein [Bacteroidota bacterium]